MTSLSFAMQNSFHGSQTSSQFFLIAFIVQSVLPLRVVVQGSTLEWVHTRLCQLEWCHILSNLGGRAAARSGLSSSLHP